MEYHARRNRRGRERRTRQSFPPQSVVVPDSQKWSLVDVFNHFLIMASLLAIVYVMLEQHCITCVNNKCDLTNITRNIDDIANNISVIKESYSDLETKVIRFSHELPKIEGQIEILESFASNLEYGDFQRPIKNISLRQADRSPECTSHETKSYEANALNTTSNVRNKYKKVAQD